MSFVYFPQLPPELRLQIFEAALLGPRIITIARLNYNRPLKGTCANISNNATLKGLYFACRDSHAAMKRHYSLYFHDRIEHPIFFNPITDTLYFPDDGELRPFLTRHGDLSNCWDIQQVRRLILPHPYAFDHTIVNFMSRRTSCAIIIATLHGFGNVKELSLVSSQDMNEHELWDFFGEVKEFYKKGNDVFTLTRGFKEALLDTTVFRVLDGRKISILLA